MFSGEYPFPDINNFKVMLAVPQGTRPSRPSHDLCRTRGLNDEMWQLIETCWGGEPSKRPTATQVVGQLEALTDRPDPRTLGNINVSPQDILYPETNFFYPPTSRSSAYNSNTSLPWNLRRSPRGPNLNDPFSTLTTTEYDDRLAG